MGAVDKFGCSGPSWSSCENVVMFVEPLSDKSTLYWYEVDVKRIVDGDTFVGTLHFGFGLSREKQYFRLGLINTPERGKLGFDEATQCLSDKINGQRVMINSAHDLTGRYKRIIAQVVYNGENVNKTMLERGHAVLVDY